MLRLNDKRRLGQSSRQHVHFILLSVDGSGRSHPQDKEELIMMKGISSSSAKSASQFSNRVCANTTVLPCSLSMAMSFPPIHPFFPETMYFCLVTRAGKGEDQASARNQGAVVVPGHKITGRHYWGEPGARDNGHADIQNTSTYLFHHGCSMITRRVGHVPPVHTGRGGLQPG